jgi:two-component system KDP operon response regulator KdpE
MLPKLSGFDVCKKTRAEGISTPIILLTARGEEIDKILGLEFGADDYITKPFGMEELMARIRAALRRVPQKEDEGSKLETGDFMVDLEAYTVSVRGVMIHLTPKEFELLSLFLKNDGKVLTHRKILSAIWGANSVEQSEYLRVFVGNLRKKIELDPSDPKYIQTEPWIGYRFSSYPN